MRPNADLYTQQYVLWNTDPITAFDGWLNGKQLKQDSMATYRHMWAVFVRWLAFNGLTLATLKDVRIREFIEKAQYREHSESPHAKHPGYTGRSLYPYHLLKLIEAAYDFFNGLPDAPAGADNPAQLVLLQSIATGRNRPPSFFSQSDQDKIVRLIREGKKDEAGQQMTDEPDGSAAARMFVRDSALIGVLLGGGLKLSEALALTISSINPDGSVQVPFSPKTRGGDKHGEAGPGMFGRTIRLEPFAHQAMSRWLAIRTQHVQTKEAWLFTSRTPDIRLDVSNANRRIRWMLDQAGVPYGEHARGSAQTLRNCFAANLFLKGTGDDDIQTIMGWADILSVGRFALHLPWEYKQGMPSQHDPAAFQAMSAN